MLRAIASAIPASALMPSLSWGEDEISLEWPDDRPEPAGLLRITLRPPDGRKLPSSVKVLVKIQDKWLEVPRGASELIYEKEVPAGQRYVIRVTASDYMTIERSVPVDRALAVARIYLVPQGWPYYFAGGIEVPFEPRPRLAGVALGTRVMTPAELANLFDSAAKAGFERVTKDPYMGGVLDDVNGSVFYFVPKDPNVAFFSFAANPTRSHGRVAQGPVNQLKGLFGKYEGRVGSPAQLQAGQVRIVDNQYLIRFPRRITAVEVERYARGLGAIVLQEADSNAGFWLIEFADPQNLGRHLDVIAQQLRSGSLTSGEPNLIFQLQAHAKPQLLGSFAGYIRKLACSMAPDNDPYEGCQLNLSRQRVDDAWCYIEQYVAGGRYGLPSIRVATLDTGITFSGATMTSSHPDVNSARVGYCYNLANSAPCTEAASSLPGHNHGMGSYGIISAKPDNHLGITGIAPNVTHIAVELVSIITNSVLYAQALLWVGGVRPTPPAQRPGAPNPIPRADIISCSHGLDGGVVPDVVSSALKQLTCQGRNGLGTIIVYSAGNLDRYIEDENELATHPHTIGVANTEVTNGKETRQHRPIVGNDMRPYSSNYGPGIDLCANGESAPSLLGNPALDGPDCEDDDAGVGVYLHGGTSAAASMVSAAAALVLTINPQLSWAQVRSILCASAVKVDCGNPDPSSKWRWSGLTAQTQPLPTPCTSLPLGLTWFSDWYGYGRLDVYQAVKMARTTPAMPSPPCATF